MEWRPIDTAPTDGTDVLIFAPQFSEQFVAFYGRAADGDCRWVFGRAQGMSLVVKNPTHWMPLPEPPK